MKQYKFISDIWSSSVESELNKMAEHGWAVKSFNIAYEGEDNSNQRISALMEIDDFDIENSLDEINDKLETIISKSQSGTHQSEDRGDLHSKLSQIIERLDWINENTSN